MKNYTPPKNKILSKCFVIILMFLFITSIDTYAQIQVPFTQRTSQYTPTTKIYNIKGDFTIIGNTNLTLVNYGDEINNSNNDMKFVDIDGVASTQNSSSANLTFSTENGAIPSCSKVLFAGLYWTGRTNGSVTDATKRNIKVKAPGQASYQSYTALPSNIRYPGDNDMYAGYIEITDQVKNYGIGQYFVADIATSTGDGGSTGYYGGWNIIVVYENSKMKWRDVTVFDGYAYVQGNTTVNFELPVSGFNTVQAGPVNMKLGIVAGEGDRGIPGDYFEIQKVSDNSWLRLSHAGNSTTNFFNSSIQTGGNTRNPNILNNTGLDISMFNIPNAGNSVITNNQTSTKFRYGSTQDTYVIFNVVMSVDAYIPDPEGVSSLITINGVPAGSGPYTVLPGQDMEFKIKVLNEGSEAVNNTKITIPIPYTSNYVPGSASRVVNFLPLPTPNSLTFNPLLGANGTLIWDIGTLPLPANPSDVLGELTFKLKATEDCSILKNPNCQPAVNIYGYISGTGAISGVNINNKPFIQGYTASGICLGEPITDPLQINIDAQNYVNQHCQNTPNEIAFTFCNVSNPIPVSQISGAFPPGTRFYNHYPITLPGTVEYTGSNPFPATPGTTTYYGIPPGSTNCYYAFTITIVATPILTAPADYTLEACSVSAITGLPYSTTPVSITLAQFLAAGGTTTNQSLAYTITYVDTSAGSCPKIVTRKFTINTSCQTGVILTQHINIDDNTAPILPTGLPQNVTVACNQVPPMIQLTATDNCSGAITVSGVDTITSSNCASEYSISRKWTFTDACGNTVSHTQIITVEDNVNPVLVGTLPANTTVSCDAVPTAPVLTATDNCSGPAAVVYTQTITGQNDGCASEYTITRKWSVTDCAGNNTTHTQIINVEDNTNPVLVGTLPANATVSCNAVPTAPVLTATDNCDSQVTVVYTQTITGQNDSCAAEYTITRKWSVTDCAGNNTSHTQIINVEDNTNPVLVGTLPANVTVSCDAIPTAPVLTATDNCDSQVTVVYTQTITGQNDGCAAEYTITRKWSVTDCAGNNTSYTQIINVEDNTNPVLVGILPANTTVSCNAVPTAPVLTATDNCDSQVTVVYTQTITGQNDGCAAEYTITRKWSVTDCAGNNTSYTQTINVEDNTNPVLVGTLPANVTVSCDAIPTAPVLTATDNCDSQVTVVYTQTITGQNDGCAAEYTITRKWSVTDCAGNNTSYTQTINVEDNTNPVLVGTLPANVTVSCDAIPTAPVLTATDNCDSQVTVVYTQTITGQNDGCAAEYTITRKWSVTDCAGNNTSYTQTINVEDNTNPVLVGTLPANVTVSCDAIPTAPVLTATDNCDSQVTVVYTQTITGQNDGCAAEYTITRKWSVTDCAGNNTSYTQTINVEDNTNPVLVGTLPANVTVSCDAIPTAPVLTATDNCDSQVTVVYTQTITGQNDGCAAEYTITRKWSVTDCAGNNTSYTQTINVEDNTNPVLVGTLPANVTVSCDAIPTAPVLTATDNCDSQVTVVYTQTITGQNDGCAAEYTITRKWSVTDCAGNNTSYTQTINVEDNTNPVLVGTLPANVTVSCDAIPTAPVLTATDNCDSQVTVVYTQTITGQNDGCAAEYTITRKWSVTDCAGNNTSYTQTINVEDNTNPVLVGTLPANAIVSCDAVPTAPVLTATDNCDSQVQVIYTETFAGQDDGCGSEYTITRNWSVTDCAGNNTSYTQTINVEDNTNPVLVGTLPANAIVSCDAVPTAPVLTATDNCDSQVQVIYTETFAGQDDGCGSEYTITRNWSVTDCAGNNTSHTQTINVEDTTNPVLIGELPENATVQCDAVPTAPVISASDNCDNQVQVVYTETFAGQDDNCSSEYVITRTWSVTDCAGNNTSHTQIITVEDTTDPIFNTEVLPADVTVSCDAVPTAPVISASDNCDNQVQVVYTETFAGQDDDCPSEYTIIRNWSVSDCAGNNTSHTQIINVEDTTLPVFIGNLPSDITVSCDAVPAAPVIVATDNCDNNISVVYNETIEGQDDGCASEYIITRNWSVTDCAGNNIKHVQVITVEDTTNPIFNAEVLPADATVSCDAVPVAPVITASDNCDNQVQVVYTETFAGQDDECSSEYTITRNWSVTDCAGNNTSHTQTINVEDTTNPIFNAEVLPVDVTVSCDAVPTAPVITASDNCDNQVQVVYTETFAGQDDECSSEYTITRNWSVTDCAGNNTSHTQVITVEDTTNPIFNAEVLPVDVTVSCDAVPTAPVISASDNCDNQAQVIYTETFAGQDDGCGYEYTITRNWSVTDCAGNNTSHTQTINVEDTTNPIFNAETLPGDVTVQCDAIPVAPVITASDNCDNQVEVVYTENINHNEEGCASNYTITRTWTATDCAENSTIHSQVITVEDTAAPVITLQASNVTVECDGNGNQEALNSWLATFGGAAATDNCSTVTWSNNFEGLSDDCGNTGMATVIFTATDDCGNQSSSTGIFIIQDTQDPTLNGEFPEVLDVTCSNIPTEQPQFTDSCSGITVVASEPVITNETDYGYTLTNHWIATDACGNFTEITQTINVTLDEPFSTVNASVCVEETSFDLFTLLELSEEETNPAWWVDVNNVGGLNGSILNPSALQPGFYVFNYEIPNGNCPRIIAVYMTINDDCVVLPCTIADLNISKVVTPNNDSYNDFFEIGGIEECGFTYDVKIFNRWGALIYENPDYKNNWDGKAKSAISDSNLPAGTYYYVVNIVNSGFDVFNGYIYLGTKN